MPYIKGLGEKIRRILRSADINTAFKPHTTRRRLLVSPKDPIPQMQKTGVVYHKCKDCNADYIGETERQFKNRLPEHRWKSQKDKSVMAHHIHYR